MNWLGVLIGVAVFGIVLLVLREAKRDYDDWHQHYGD